MMRIAPVICLWLFLCCGVAFAAGQASESGPSAQTPAYTADGQLVFPANYREWIYLSSGIDMSYFQQGMAHHSMFDTVFVNPDAYRSFLQTGTWPDKTMLVLEVRGAGSNASINKSGHFQTTELMGREVHVKDESRFPGKWAFFGFDDKPTAKMVPKEAACYSCHEQHGAVDTTFVQFYPTLIDIAKQKSTLSAAYLKESSNSEATSGKK
ncbi:MAG TPA: cytochrome P460 family protein [Terriglobales bacterium]|nr:cytochrome P460 family protein [Terriglobales bacterium]